MIISCPNCSAHYSVPITALGEEGRTLRCAKCAHTWEQLPYEESILELDEHEVTTAPPPPPPAPEPLPDPEPEPEPMFEPEPEPEPVIETMADDEPTPAPESVHTSDSFDDTDMPSDEELNDIFGDDDIEPMQSMAESMYSKDDIDDLDSLDDLDDPDPIPEVFTAPVRHKEKKKKKGSFFKFLFWLIFILALLIGCLHFGRSLIMQFVPQAAPVYNIYDSSFSKVQDMLGMKPQLSDLMEIRDVHSSRRKEGNDNLLIIAGDVGNISESSQVVPQIRVSLFDATDAEVQFVIVDTKDKEVAAGGTTPFEALIKNPIASARRLEVTFVDPQTQQ